MLIFHENFLSSLSSILGSCHFTGDFQLFILLAAFFTQAVMISRLSCCGMSCNFTSTPGIHSAFLLCCFVLALSCYKGLWFLSYQAFHLTVGNFCQKDPHRIFFDSHQTFCFGSMSRTLLYIIVSCEILMLSLASGLQCRI